VYYQPPTAEPMQNSIQFEYSLPLEGEALLPNPGLQVRLMRHQANEQPTLLLDESNQWVASFDYEELMFPLILRNRRAGDRIQPLGMDGHKKVKDIFIDEKIPASLRQSWPVIMDQSGIIWLPGLKKADRGKITNKTTQVITIMVAKV